MIINGPSGSSSCVPACSGCSSSSTSPASSRPAAAALVGVEPAQGAREPRDLPVELAISEPADLARLALPDDGRLVAKLPVAVAIETALDDVHAGPDPPLRPRLTLGQVDDLVVLAIEGDVDVFDRGIPEPLDVVVRAFQQLVEGLDPVAVHEALEPAALDDLLARLPDHIPDHHRLHGLIVTARRWASFPRT